MKFQPTKQVILFKFSDSANLKRNHTEIIFKHCLIILFSEEKKYIISSITDKKNCLNVSKSPRSSIKALC